MAEDKEKEVSSKGQGTDFETFLSEKMVNGNLSLKRGKFNTFVEISKIVSYEGGNATWANIRIEKQDILVIRKFLNDSFEYMQKNVEDPFGLDALKAQLESVEAK